MKMQGRQFSRQDNRNPQRVLTQQKRSLFSHAMFDFTRISLLLLAPHLGVR